MTLAGHRGFFEQDESPCESLIEFRIDLASICNMGCGTLEWVRPLRYGWKGLDTEETAVDSPVVEEARAGEPYGYGVIFDSTDCTASVPSFPGAQSKRASSVTRSRFRSKSSAPAQFAPYTA